MEEKYRMYCLTERHLSPMQKGIQSAHAIVEYANNFGNTKEYMSWAFNDKTLVVLDGGIVPDLQETFNVLNGIHCNYAVFCEPDMNYMPTAIALIANERIFDYEHYGRNYEHYQKLCAENENLENLNYDEWLEAIGGKSAETLKELISSCKLAL